MTLKIILCYTVVFFANTLGLRKVCLKPMTKWKVRLGRDAKKYDFFVCFAVCKNNDSRNVLGRFFYKLCITLIHMLEFYYLSGFCF